MHKRLPLLVVVGLIAVGAPAMAEDHFLECFSGVSSQKQERSDTNPNSFASTTETGLVEEPLALRASCGLRLFGTDYSKAHLSMSNAVPRGALTRNGRSLFSFMVVGDVGWYVIGADKAWAGWLAGPRLWWGRHGRSIDWFVHLLYGKQPPSSGVGDSLTLWSPGGGADFEMTDPEVGDHPSLVPVLRVQFDLVDSSATEGFDPYPRATFGFSFRFEGLKSPF